MLEPWAGISERLRRYQKPSALITDSGASVDYDPNHPGDGFDD